MLRTNSFDLKRNSLPLTRLVAAGLVLGALVLQAGPKDGQRTFATPQEAVQAAIDAAEHNDTAALLQLFGPAGKDIVESGDPAQDKIHRAEFARSAREKLEFDKDASMPDRVSFAVGEQDWPFPVPLVRRDGKWQFDSASGKIEILARRIGRNELNAMEVCRGYAEAQMAYAAAARGGDRILKYAQNIASTTGKQDGLYSEGVPGTLVSRAFAEAAAAERATGNKKPTPYHGYYFRVLKSQGPDAAGGAFDYVVNGKMIGGFALVAWPAEYGVSGIRTLIINHEGVVYEKDLGAGTAILARQMTRFNPDKSWRPVVLE
ncbi:MAG: DUF2950 domain-containing protein [Bryobacteraceae bacterium]|nr:DUF2950 domain-containing protein [Bryobacteraceae bacterium]